MVLSDCTVDALFKSDEQLQQWLDGSVVGVDYEGTVLDFNVGN